MSARWDPYTTFPADMELEEKFLWLTAPVLGEAQAESLAALVWNFEQEETPAKMIDLCIVHNEV